MIIEYPTKDSIKYHSDGTVYIVANDATVHQYCDEKGYTLNGYIAEEQRFSNNGAVNYMYYEDGEWKLEFGFSKIVISLDVD